jgi:hypothetical protein
MESLKTVLRFVFCASPSSLPPFHPVPLPPRAGAARAGRFETETHRKPEGHSPGTTVPGDPAALNQAPGLVRHGARNRWPGVR